MVKLSLFSWKGLLCQVPVQLFFSRMHFKNSININVKARVANLQDSVPSLRKSPEAERDAACLYCVHVNTKGAMRAQPVVCT